MRAQYTWEDCPTMPPRTASTESSSFTVPSLTLRSNHLSPSLCNTHSHMGLISLLIFVFILSRILGFYMSRFICLFFNWYHISCFVFMVYHLCYLTDPCVVWHLGSQIFHFSIFGGVLAVIISWENIFMLKQDCPCELIFVYWT